MSGENVEIVQRAAEAWARGDLVAMVRDVEPDAVTFRAHPDGATFEGPDGFLRALAEWAEEFDDFDATASEFAEVNEQQVLFRVHQTGIGQRSGATTEADFWFLYTFDRSKIIRMEMFAGKAEALEAAGPSE